MLFLDALTQLEAGVAMVRDTWTEEDGYLSMMPGMKYVWKIILLPNPNAGNFIFSVEDFTADNWMPYVAPVEALEAE